VQQGIIWMAMSSAPRKASPVTAKSGSASPPGGLRARKREQTQARLTRVAMELFLARGFEATTLDDIAAAADISRRSFFHYFASKEDVVLAWQDGSAAAMAAAIAARPAAESMLTAAENAILEMARQLRPDEAIALARLKRDTPALQAREQVKYEKMEKAMAAALGGRAGDAAGRVKARLVAMITTGAIRVASESWLAEGAHEKPEALVKRTFKAIRAILDEPPGPKSKA
jgi:AcrR family transcriptional regulator